MDQIHDEAELKKYKKFEKNFNTRKYLTIKDKKIVIGRIYPINSDKGSSIKDVMLNKQAIDIILAFFKYFRIPNSGKVVDEIAGLTTEDINTISVDLIRNNVFKQEAY